MLANYVGATVLVTAVGTRRFLAGANAPLRRTHAAAASVPPTQA